MTRPLSIKLLAPEVASYLETLVPSRPRELRKMEVEAARTRFPIIGPVAGQLCYLITRLTGARSVFELGSGFGYSTAWFARGVIENGGGVVHHTVWDEGLSARARQHLAALRLDSVVEFRVDEAIQTLRGSKGEIDLIFLDIDKHAYPAALPVIKERLRPAGVLIADNVLWHGAIFDKSDRSARTTGVRKLTRLVTEDSSWIASLIPIRDGVLVAKKQSS